LKKYGGKKNKNVNPLLFDGTSIMPMYLLSNKSLRIIRT